jgi:hypothetical protein
MRDVPARFDRKNESALNLFLPSVNRFDFRQMVESVVYFNGWKSFRIEGQPVLLFQVVRVEWSAPMRVIPPRRSDMKLSGGDCSLLRFFCNFF